MVRSGVVLGGLGGRTSIRSLAVLFRSLLSLPPDTVATFSTVDAVAATSAATAIGGYDWPGPSGSSRSQVRLTPLMPQFQPDPLALVGVNPAGNVSFTVTVPLVASLP